MKYTFHTEVQATISTTIEADTEQEARRILQEQYIENSSTDDTVINFNVDQITLVGIKGTK